MAHQRYTSVEDASKYVQHSIFYSLGTLTHSCTNKRTGLSRGTVGVIRLSCYAHLISGPVITKSVLSRMETYLYIYRTRVFPARE